MDKQQQAAARSLEPVKGSKPVLVQQVRARAKPWRLLASRPFIAMKASLSPTKHFGGGERCGSPVVVPQDEGARRQMTEIVGSKYVAPIHTAASTLVFRGSNAHDRIISCCESWTLSTFFCSTLELLSPKIRWQGLGMVSGGSSEVLPTLSRTVSTPGFYDADL